MLEATAIHHISLNVTDLQRAVKFYKEVLQLKEIERPAFDFPGAWFAIGTEGQQLHLIVHRDAVLRNKGLDTRDHHFALRVKSYQAAIDWLDRCGVSYEARPHSKAGFPQIYVLDPDRNIVEINARTAAE